MYCGRTNILLIVVVVDVVACVSSWFWLALRLV